MATIFFFPPGVRLLHTATLQGDGVTAAELDCRGEGGTGQDSLAPRTSWHHPGGEGGSRPRCTAPPPSILREFWIFLIILMNHGETRSGEQGPPRSCKWTALPCRDRCQGHICELVPEVSPLFYSSPAPNGEGGVLPASGLGSVLVSAIPGCVILGTSVPHCDHGQVVSRVTKIMPGGLLVRSPYECVLAPAFIHVTAIRAHERNPST